MAEVTFVAGKFSPFSQRVHVALLEKGIPFDMIVANLLDKPAILLEANPIHKKVPAILHNGKPVAESLVILHYLEDAFPDKTPLLPKDAYEKSQVLFWTEYIYSTFSSFIVIMTKPRGTPEHQAGVEASIKIFKDLEEAMVSFSKDGPFFTGDKFGFLDAIMSPMAGSLLLLKDVGGVVLPGPEEMPRLYKWLSAAKERPSVKEGVPSEEAVKDNFIAMIKKRAAAAAAAAPPAQ